MGGWLLGGVEWGMEMRVVVAAAVAKGQWGVGPSFLCVWRDGENFFVFVLAVLFHLCVLRYSPHVRSLFVFGPL